MYTANVANLLEVESVLTTPAAQVVVALSITGIAALIYIVLLQNKTVGHMVRRKDLISMAIGNQ